MSLLILAVTLQNAGTLAIAYAALSVHHRFLRERKVDEKVFLTMRVEQVIGVVGVIATLAGYILEIVHLA